MATKLAISAVVLAVLCALSGCHMTIATPKGQQAYADMLNGLITNGKESPNRRSAYYENRDSYEKQVTMRENNEGFLSKLFRREQGGS